MDVIFVGFCLQGAAWNPETNLLDESRSKKVYAEMPVIWLLTKANRAKPIGGIYDCPVYKKLTRAGKFKFNNRNSIDFWTLHKLWIGD